KYYWSKGGPASLPVDNFSARWTRNVSFPAGSVTFTVRADDGVRLFLDGVAIIDQWHDQPATTYTATRTVTAGTHEVRVEYYEKTGDAVIQVSWTGGAPPPRTDERRTGNTGGAGGPAFTLTDGGTNFVSGDTVRWTGRFSLSKGNYPFTARADDGVRVFLDGAPIIDQWHDQPATTYTANVSLPATGEHEIKVEYYERAGDAVIQVSWKAVAPTPPTLASIAPSTATAGGPAFTLTADGGNFVSTSSVS